MNETRSSTEKDAKLLNDIICGLVDAPELVKVNPVVGTRSVIFEVMVAKPDVRRVIGRRGRTADAVRELLLNLGAKAGHRYVLDIQEPELSEVIALGEDDASGERVSQARIDLLVRHED